jgi:hypothetical protein
MAERRSIGDAMTMTPAKLAFIKGEGAKQTKDERAVVTDRKSKVETTIALEEPTADKGPPIKTRPRTNRRTNRSIKAPEASEVLDQVLVPVTFRLSHRTAQAVKRAYLEQKLKLAKPDTLQEIGEEALSDWLTRNGFWIDY